MSRQPANPYKEPAFYETFSKDSPPLQNTANFKQISQQFPENLDKFQEFFVVMSAEIERLHGIIQALVLRYKDLEAKTQGKDREFQAKAQTFEEKIRVFRDESEKNKQEVAQLLVEREELTQKLAEKAREVEILRTNAGTSLGNAGNFASLSQENRTKIEVNYSSEPAKPQLSYDFYGKTQENAGKSSEFLRNDGQFDDFHVFKGTVSQNYDYEYKYSPQDANDGKFTGVSPNPREKSPNFDYYRPVAEEKYEKFGYESSQKPGNREEFDEFSKRFAPEYTKEPEFGSKYLGEYEDSAYKYRDFEDSAQKNLENYQKSSLYAPEFKESRDYDDFHKGYQSQYYSDSKY